MEKRLQITACNVYHQYDIDSSNVYDQYGLKGQRRQAFEIKSALARWKDKKRDKE